jgi:hypothetical protein
MLTRRVSLIPAFASAMLMAAAASAVRGQQASANSNTVPLAGEWRFAMDPKDVGKTENWMGRALPDKIKLPGILQSQGYGNDIGLDTPWVAALPRSDPDDPGAPFTLKRWWRLPEYQAYTKPGNIKVPYLSQPPKHYLGVAWYQRDIEIPAGWQGKVVQLYLERPRWGSEVWIDDKQVGTGNSLVAPHEFQLGVLSPGKHTLSIRLDNRMTVVPGPPSPPNRPANAPPIPAYRPDGHSVSDALGQTWNGIVGQIELRAKSPVFIADAQVFPNVTTKSALIKVSLGNTTGQGGSGTLRVGTTSAPITWTDKGGEGTIQVTLGPDAKLWDEFHPNLTHLDVALSGDGAAAQAASDSVHLSFGLREITHDGPKMLLNGREINLRGTHSGGDFPLTGYPATDVDSWKKIIQICKDHGLNHIRFHSWCPPEAAFQAADELGFYLQPECGMWNNFSNPGMAEMLEAETTRMQQAYGNHPSYLLLSPTNEPAGAWQRVLPQWAGRWYEKDPRRLYAENTGRVSLRDVGPTFAITALRGPGGWFGRDYGGTNQDRGNPGGGPAATRPAVQMAQYPIVTHEVGQWCAYPDFDLIKKFTGYLQPGNYEIYRDSAAAHGVLDRNKEWAYNSGKFQVACYKEEIEANLRTPALSGFQLLDLHDYLGQGGALVGVLDPFWESKGYVTPEEFRRFCSETVPLARMRNYVLKTSDAFSIPLEMAHYGASPIRTATPYYKIVDSAGKTVKEKDLPAREIPIGKNIPLGTAEADLSQFASPMHYKLIVGLRGTKIENDWNFWLYPAQVETTAPADILLTGNWKEAQAKLAAGGKVLYTPPANELDDTCPPLNNVPVFWNRLMNPKLEAMLGLVCDAKHPALAQFPTDTWCDFQWTELVRNVRAINVEHAPRELRPIVSAIDDWARNYKLGVLFECRVGPGTLLVSAIDLQSNLERRTTASQLRKSVLSYMAGGNFDPKIALTAAQADQLWPANRPRAATRPANTAPGYNPGDVIESPALPPRER